MARSHLHRCLGGRDARVWDVRTRRRPLAVFGRGDDDQAAPVGQVPVDHDVGAGPDPAESVAADGGLDAYQIAQIVTIVVLAMRDCGGWLKRRSPARRRGASARKAASNESAPLRSPSAGRKGCADILKNWLPARGGAFASTPPRQFGCGRRTTLVSQKQRPSAQDRACSAKRNDRLSFPEILRLALAVKLISRSQSKGGDGGDCGPSRGDPVGRGYHRFATSPHELPGARF